MKKSLPKYLSHNAFECLKALATFDDPVPMQDLKATVGWEGTATALQLCMKDANRNGPDKLFNQKQVSNRRYLYSLTAYGKHCFTQQAHIIINRPSTPRKYKVKDEQQSMFPMADPEPVQVNTSKAADTVVDGISLLVQENAQYRNLLLKIHGIITDALQLKENDDGTSS